MLNELLPVLQISSLNHGGMKVKNLIFSTFIILMPPVAHCGDLANVISDLYGGDGIELSAASGAFHSPHFTADSLSALENLNQVITNDVGFSSFNSIVNGVTFDVSMGIPVATNDSLGPLLSERATTLGKNVINFAFSYTKVSFDKLDGTDLDSLNINFSHDDCCGFSPFVLLPDGSRSNFELDSVNVSIDLELEQDILSFFVNYGVSDHLDVGMMVPIIQTEARATAFATIVESVSGSGIHTFAGSPELASSSTGGEETGIGDILLRSKYNFFDSHPDFPDMAVLGQLSLPTGDKDNLLGSGETKFKGMFIISKNFEHVNPHINLAYEVTTGDDSEDNLQYAVGADVRVTQNVTIAADILGRYNPDLEITGNHLVDFAFAAKWNPFKEINAPLNGYVIIPINSDEGLRSDVIWGFGAEYTFD